MIGDKVNIVKSHFGKYIEVDDLCESVRIGNEKIGDAAACGCVCCVCIAIKVVGYVKMVRCNEVG